MDDPRLRAFAELLAVIDRLRGEGGCPWDRAQSIGQIAPSLLEEAYEVTDALLAHDRKGITEELGDLLMNVLLAARIGEDAGAFSLKEVAEGIHDKLVRRHPHVFGETEVDGVDEVLRNWEEIKQVERSGTSDESALAGVPAALPALLRAYRMGEKGAKVGFKWADIRGAIEKLDEEIVELKEAIAGGEERRISEELGDVLFCAVNVARHAKVEPESALRQTSARFEERFRYIEMHLGKPMKEASLPEMETLWLEAKSALRSKGAAIPENASDDWRRAIWRLQEAREDLIDAVRDLPPDIVTRLPDPNVSRWSVVNVLEHLGRVESVIAVGMRRLAKEGKERGDVPPYPPEGLASFPVKNQLFMPTETVPAPPGLAEEWTLDRDAAIAALQESRSRLLKPLPDLVTLHPRHLLSPHPFFGDLDVLQWYIFSAAHDRVHLAQIRRIVKSLL